VQIISKTTENLINNPCLSKLSKYKMEKQQLVHKGKDMTDVDRKVREIKETLDKIWKDPKAMKEIEALAAS